MNKKIFENTRFLLKGDIEANWKKATGFIPLAKEIIIYKPDENYSYSRIKIGDGVTGVNDLPFVVDTDGYLASKDWVDEQIAAIDFPDADRIYSPESENAQSGIAVSNALSPIKENDDKQNDRIDELEDKVIIVTFNIQKPNTNITLKNLAGMTKINWGDGTVNNELFHTYMNVGEYICKIYGEITVIGERAFSSNDKITNIIIPNSITSIAKYAFDGCENLLNITIGKGVKSFGSDAFSECSNLTNVYYQGKIEDWCAIEFEGFYNVATGRMYCYSNPQGYADNFYINNELLSMTISIPDSITTISAFAFQNKKINQIIVPSSVTFVGEGAFSCDSLSSIEFKNTTPVPYHEAWFYGVDTNLLKIKVPLESLDAYKDAWPLLKSSIIASSPVAHMSDVSALKTEIEEQLVGKTDYLGTIAAMADLSTIAGAGDYHRVSTEFVYDEVTGEVAHVGDILIAIIDNPSQTKDYWDLIHTELGAAPATSEEINSIFEEA